MEKSIENLFIKIYSFILLTVEVFSVVVYFSWSIYLFYTDYSLAHVFLFKSLAPAA